jgi:transcriptional regulator with XRE-family HTH domain
MHRSYYSAIERGEKNLTLETMLRLSEGLGVPLSKLFETAKV